MLQRLVESGVRPRAHPGWTLASSMAHASLIAGAIALTTQATSVRPAPPRATHVVYVPARPTTTAPRPATGGYITGLRPGRIVAPTVVPPAIPAIDLGAARPLDGIASELLVGSSVIGTASPTTITGGVHAYADVDRAVAAVRTNPRPQYPVSLRSAGLEGDVLVRFIVDTSGAVEDGSVTILRTTHELFADAVRRWLPATRYVPAEVRGGRVRQLVEQRVEFTITR